MAPLPTGSVRDAAAVAVEREAGVVRRDASANGPDGGFVDAAVDAAIVVVPPPPPRDAGVHDARVDASSIVDAGCKLEGSYALRTEVEISWAGWTIAGIPILSPGQGTFTMDALSEMREADQRATVRPCGVTIPDFETERNSLISELYGAYVPDEVWERPSMPSWQTSWSASCRVPGCTVFTSAIQAVIGARVTSNPYKWPGPSDPRTDFQVVDDDGDGLPGLTFTAKGPMDVNGEGRMYAYPPVGISLSTRARRIMMAVGMRTQMEGKLETCDRVSGALTVMSVNSRALGCSGMRGQEPFTCEPGHVKFLDENMPVWQLKSAKFQSMRVRDGATCDDVRGALRAPPPRSAGGGQ